MCTIYKYKSQSSDWGTPIWLKTLLENKNYIDICPFPRQAGYDALAIEWPDQNIFCNPPFSELSKWGIKALQEYKKNNNRKICLMLPVDRLYRNYVLPLLQISDFILVTEPLYFESLGTQRNADKGFHLPIVLLILGGDGKFIQINSQSTQLY